MNTTKHTPESLGLPDGYKYHGYGTDNAYSRVIVEVWPLDGEYRPTCLFTATFAPLIPFGQCSLPDSAMIEKVDASTFACDIDMQHVLFWVENACELYGGLPVHLNTWDKELSYYQGRWIDRLTGDPFGLEEEIA